MIEHQKAQHEAEIMTLKMSNDTRDSVLTNCKICKHPVRLQAMRTHTKTKHDVNITDYKKKYNQQDFYDPIEIVLHKCGFCGEYLLLDSDAMSEHLKIKKKKLENGPRNK